MAPAEAVFGLLGALLGAAAGAGSAFGWRVAHKDHNREADDSTVDTDTVVHSAKKPKAPRGKYEVLGVRTNYFDSKSPIYPPLMQLSIRLQYKPETERFAALLKMIDDLYGMRKVYHGLKDRDVSRNPDYPVIAQAALRHIEKKLDAIVKFSAHDTVYPSETKRQDLAKFAKEIKQHCATVVDEIQRLLASTPYYHS